MNGPPAATADRLVCRPHGMAVYGHVPSRGAWNGRCGGACLKKRMDIGLRTVCATGIR